MLKGISPIISPDLLATLSRMGHGDEIVLADAHFPGESLNNNILRADGVKITDLLNAILPLFELDSYVSNPLVMMEVVEGDTLDPSVEKDYFDKIKITNPQLTKAERLERIAFYERSKKAFSIVITGDTRKYGNIILKKGVTPIFSFK